MKSTMTPAEQIQKVKSALLSYAKTDRWNNNTVYHLGFNDEAQMVIDMVADGNFGFASEIATTVRKFKYSISEKQAYWIAKTAVEKLEEKVFKSVIFNN